jgi:hypothetical protein
MVAAVPAPSRSPLLRHESETCAAVKGSWSGSLMRLAQARLPWMKSRG